MFSQRRLWATVEMPVGWAKTCARPFWKYTKINKNKNPHKNMNYPTELFMSALRQPMRVVCSGLCLVSWSRLPRKSSKASRPPCSTNLRTKLCGCVLSAVFKASICLVLALNSSSSPVKDNWKKNKNSSQLEFQVRYQLFRRENNLVIWSKLQTECFILSRQFILIVGIFNKKWNRLSAHVNFKLNINRHSSEVKLLDSRIAKDKNQIAMYTPCGISRSA